MPRDLKVSSLHQSKKIQDIPPLRSGWVFLCLGILLVLSFG
ncbi:hypothetical protein HMPREF3224_02006 [Anaerococcus hydrogenalis]|nr:hypothetical protein HMPREF3224_02006 [Anaerococcus hydrogenalis]